MNFTIESPLDDLFHIRFFNILKSTFSGDLVVLVNDQENSSELEYIHIFLQTLITSNKFFSNSAQFEMSQLVETLHITVTYKQEDRFKNVLPLWILIQEIIDFLAVLIYSIKFTLLL